MTTEVPAADGVQARSGVHDEPICPPHWTTILTKRETPGDVDTKGKQVSVKVRVCTTCTQEVPIDYKAEDDPANPDNAIEPHTHTETGS